MVYKLKPYVFLALIFGVFVNIANFIKEVRTEVRKISWPSVKEIYMSVALVAAMTLIAGLFFLMIDAVVHNLITFILNLGV